MNGVIFSHINYTNPSKTFDEYQKLYNAEVEFLKDKKWLAIPKNINPNNLISSHPFWKRYSIKQRRKYFYKIAEDINQCKEDNSKIKYLFNATETIESLNKKLNKLRKSIYDKVQHIN